MFGVDVHSSDCAQLCRSVRAVVVAVALRTFQYAPLQLLRASQGPMRRVRSLARAHLIRVDLSCIESLGLQTACQSDTCQSHRPRTRR